MNAGLNPGSRVLSASGDKIKEAQPSPSFSPPAGRSGSCMFVTLLDSAFDSLTCHEKAKKTKCQQETVHDKSAAAPANLPVKPPVYTVPCWRRRTT